MSLEVPEEREYWRVIESDSSSTIDGSVTNDQTDSIPGGSINELSMCDPHSPLYGKSMVDYERLKTEAVESSKQKWISSINIDPPKKGHHLTLTEVSAVTLNIDKGHVTTIKDALPEFDHVIESPSKVTCETTMVSSNQMPSFNDNVPRANQQQYNSRKSVDVNGNEYSNKETVSSSMTRIGDLNTKKKRKLNLQLRKENDVSDEEVGPTQQTVGRTFKISQRGTPTRRGTSNLLCQWRIQDFPEGGLNSQSGCANLFFLPKTA